MSSPIYNLVVEIPGASARHYQLNSRMISVGRGERNMIIIDEDAVSGTHCEIRRKGSVFSLVDLGSTNGTRVNGESVQGEAKELRDGDVISLGLAAKVRFVHVVEVKDKTDAAGGEPGATTRRLKRNPARPAINPVAAAVAKAAKGGGS